jgi:uncharacterized protein (DUF305 family)
MAERVVAEEREIEVAGLADAVIATREAEVERMPTWLDEWELDRRTAVPQPS